MRRHLEQQALGPAPGNCRRPGIAPLENPLRRLKHQITLLLRQAVTRQTVFLQDGQNVFLKDNRLSPLHIRHRNRRSMNDIHDRQQH